MVLLCLAQLMLVLDLTVVNVALPDLARDLRLGRVTLTWVISIYALLFGALMVLGGQAADRFGPRRLVLLGLGVFVAGSLTAGAASAAPTLLSGRALQGIGAAMLSPAALALVTTAFDAEDRRRALSMWAAVGGVGATFGVLLGGVLTAGPGWRWVFWINVPVGVGLLLVLPGAVGGARPSSSTSRLDLAGALLVAAGTGLLLYALIAAGQPRAAVTATFGAAACYGLLVAVERRVAYPLLDPRLLRQRSTLGGSSVMGVTTAVLVGSFFLTSFYLQRLHGYSAVVSGAAFLPVTVAIGVGAHLAGRALARWSPRGVAVAASLLSAAGAVLAVVALQRPALVVAALSLAAGGLGVVIVTATTTALRNATPEDAGVVSATVSTFHEIGAGAGVALMSAVVGPIALAGGASPARFGDGYLTVGIGALIAAALAAVLLPSDSRPDIVVRHAHYGDD